MSNPLHFTVEGANEFSPLRNRSHHPTAANPFGDETFSPSGSGKIESRKNEGIPEGLASLTRLLTRLFASRGDRVTGLTKLCSEKRMGRDR